MNNLTEFQPRIDRLSQAMEKDIFTSSLWGDEYEIVHLTEKIRKKIDEKSIENIVFYGMGCSSVVSDIIKGFFIQEGIKINVDVVNDYRSEWFVSDDVLASENTLVIIVCYSGWSVEPCLFFDKMMHLNSAENLIVLTGGGKIEGLANENERSIIKYMLRHADREYPLYHVQQFFSIFIHLFSELGLLQKDYQKQIQQSVEYQRNYFDDSIKAKAESDAAQMVGARIVFLANAQWYTQLLKQTTMFFNEIAMVPSHRNLLRTRLRR